MKICLHNGTQLQFHFVFTNIREMNFGANMFIPNHQKQKIVRWYLLIWYSFFVLYIKDGLRHKRIYWILKINVMELMDLMMISAVCFLYHISCLPYHGQNVLLGLVYGIENSVIWLSLEKKYHYVGIFVEMNEKRKHWSM